MWLWLCLHQKKSAVTGNGSFEKSKKKKRERERGKKSTKVLLSRFPDNLERWQENQTICVLPFWFYVVLCAKTLVEDLFTCHYHIVWHVELCYVYEQQTLMVLPVRGCDFPVSAVCSVKQRVVQDSWVLENLCLLYSLQTFFMPWIRISGCNSSYSSLSHWCLSTVVPDLWSFIRENISSFSCCLEWRQQFIFSDLSLQDLELILTSENWFSLCYSCVNLWLNKASVQYEEEIPSQHQCSLSDSW